MCLSSSDAVLDTKVLVSRRLEDKNTSLGLRLEIKVLVLVLVLTKKSYLHHCCPVDEYFPVGLAMLLVHVRQCQCTSTTDVGDATSTVAVTPAVVTTDDTRTTAAGPINGITANLTVRTSLAYRSTAKSDTDIIKCFPPTAIAISKFAKNNLSCAFSYFICGIFFALFLSVF